MPSLLPTTIKDVIKTVFHVHKSILSDKTSVCIKKDNLYFDVTMRSYDRAEACELVDLHFNLLPNEFAKNNITLYKDDGFSCFHNSLHPDSEKRKKMCKRFK